MLIVFLLFFYIELTSCQITNLITNCSFLNQTYLLNSAVYDQFIFNNKTSVNLTANYAFTLSTYQFGLIYQFSSTNSLVPFPIIFDCASIVRSCQLKTMPGTTVSSRYSESINVPLVSFNYTTITGTDQFNYMGLYLKQGRYELSNCSLNNGQQMTDPQTVFYIQIQYEKSVGSSCDSMMNSCGSSSLTACLSSKCSCLSSSSSPVPYFDSNYCADLMNVSNCRIFPSRCITWCNSTMNSLCICPINTLKIQRNNLFICELPVNSKNCSINDIRQCSFGQCCIDEQCIDCSIASTTTPKKGDANELVDQRLRIALGIIAGLLGTSVIILLVAICWLRQKQKRHKIATKKFLSPSFKSSTSSSLYISPIQQQQRGKYPSSVYQISYNPKTFYRTDSFRQAVLSGTKEKQIIERVSTKRDSYNHQKDGWSSPTFSSLEFIIPSTNQLHEKNIYHVINPSPILTHAV